MKAGSQGVFKDSLVRRVRKALADNTGGGEAKFWRSAAARRDARGLLERLEKLRTSFPDRPDLQEQVLLSGHVVRLLEEASGQSVVPVQVGLVS